MLLPPHLAEDSSNLWQHSSSGGPAKVCFLMREFVGGRGGRHAVRYGVGRMGLVGMRGEVEDGLEFLRRY